MTDQNPCVPHWNADRAIREIKRLQKSRRYRDERKTFFAEGVRNFVQLVSRGYSIELIFHSQKLLTSPIARKMVRQLRRSGVPTLGVSPETFRTISLTQRASGVSAIVRQRWLPLTKAEPGQGLCWIALSHVRCAGNLGTLIRTSEAVGAAGFILVGENVDPFDPVVVRASMGSVFHQHFVRAQSDEFLLWCRDRNCTLIGATIDGEINFHEFPFPTSPVLYLGEERTGLTELQQSECHQRLRIPMTGRADSLNLGVAGSLLLYEIFRHRTN